MATHHCVSCFICGARCSICSGCSHSIVQRCTCGAIALCGGAQHSYDCESQKQNCFTGTFLLKPQWFSTGNFDENVLSAGFVECLVDED